MDHTSTSEMHPTVTVLSLTTLDDDQAYLGKIFDRWLSAVSPNCRWNLDTRSSVESAIPVLERDEVAILLCDSDGKSNAWREMLSRCESLKRPPCLIVTSRSADERLWAEALNLGAYDVLAKPFDVTEVTRTLSRAFRHWSDSTALALN
jgi:DNA-binding NtrC family response regulator